MASPLSLYIVEGEARVDPDSDESPLIRTAYLVIAESANKAAECIAFQPNKAYEKVAEDGVGRLGEYNPGMEGHGKTMQLTSFHHNGAIVLKEVI